MSTKNGAHAGRWKAKCGMWRMDRLPRPRFTFILPPFGIGLVGQAQLYGVQSALGSLAFINEGECARMLAARLRKAITLVADMYETINRAGDARARHDG